MKTSYKKPTFGSKISYDFLSKALACHAICLISEAGLLQVLSNGNSLKIKDIHDMTNAPLIMSALFTLAGSGIVNFFGEKIRFSEIGEELAQDISMISLPFIGYRKLLAKQYELLNAPKNWSENDIDYESIAAYSIGFGEENINEVLKETLNQVNAKGTLCDLGCGSGAKLHHFCELFNLAGLGIDKDPGVIKKATRGNQNPNIEFINSDIRDLNGVWEDVEIVISNFVIHDMNNEKSCKKFLNSIGKRFPRYRCLIISDIVSYSESQPGIMPGFDYVHGLQGFVPRSLEETQKLFRKSGFEILKEEPVLGMNNTFIWVLKPQ